VELELADYQGKERQSLSCKIGLLMDLPGYMGLSGFWGGGSCVLCRKCVGKVIMGLEQITVVLEGGEFCMVPAQLHLKRVVSGKHSASPRAHTSACMVASPMTS
jgi:hypothetical protein